MPAAPTPHPAPRVWSPPWHRLAVDRTGYVGVARSTDCTEHDGYWCGDINPGAMCSALESIWLDRQRHPSDIAVYPTVAHLRAAWTAYQQQLRADGLAPLRYELEAWPLCAIPDWMTVPARGVTGAVA